MTFNVVNGTWTGGETSQSAVVTLMKDGVPAAAADGGVYQITDGDVPDGTPNAGYLNTGAWRDGRNPANAIINGDTTFTFTYALIPVIPPVTPPGGGGGGGGGTTIPDGPTPLVPDPGTTIADQDVPLAAPGLNNTDHFDYIKGYVIDGQILVRPEANITRAEVIVIVNRMLDRVPDADHMLPDMKTFADNTPDMWWYADVQEATNSHEYDRAEDGVTGIWTSLLPEQDWAALEEEWATAADANVADVAPKLGTEGEKLEEEAKEPKTTGGDDGNGEE